ncbi:MAG TPA: hypothetical protein VHZ29_05500 [Rhizomicrobium sp.]|jgi:hypothetical protein|nr:hypothetical protein [Rhizomicrobium sp.]
MQSLLPIARAFGRIARLTLARMARAEKWLFDKVDRTGLHGANRKRDVAVSGYEDDLEIHATAGDLILEIHAVHSWHAEVMRQAPSGISSDSRAFAGL